MSETIITDANLVALLRKYFRDRNSLPDDLKNLPIGKWNVSRVTDMSEIFSRSRFNEDISEWDVSNVTNMSEMFYGADMFNQPIGKWKNKTGKVTNMYRMFCNTASFDQPIEEWDVSSVKDMKQMFYQARAFNQPLNGWNVSNVEEMDGMFAESIFNQPINEWDVSNVRYMPEMFRDNEDFNQDISGWDVSNVISMGQMFDGADSFDQNLDDWTVNAELNMNFMFNHRFRRPTWYRPEEDNVASDEDEDEDYQDNYHVENINTNYTKIPITNKAHIDLKINPTLRDSIIAGEDIDIKSHVLQKTDGEYEYWIFVHELINSQNEKQYYYSLIHKDLIKQFFDYGKNANDINFRMLMSRLGISIGAKIYYKHFVDVYNNVYNPRHGPNIYFIQKLKNDADAEMYFLRYVNKSTFFNKFNVSNVRSSKKIDLHPLKPYNSILKKQFKSLNRSKPKEFFKGSREILGRRIAIKRIGKSIRDVSHHRLSPAKKSIRVRSYSPRARTRSRRSPSKSITRRRSY